MFKNKLAEGKEEMKFSLVLFISTIFLLTFINGFNCQVAPTGIGFSIAQYGTTLTTKQVIGDESCYDQNLYGTGGCILDRGATSRPLITCEVIHNAEDPIEVTIREGLPGSNQTSDRVVYTFQEGEFQFGFFAGEIIRSTFDINEESEDEIAFFNGLWYIYIKTLSCPNGALRGQFTAQFNVGSYLKGGNEVPPIASPEEGIALGTYDFASNTLINRIDFTAKRVTSVGLYNGTSDVEGPSLYNFTSTDAPIDQVFVLSEREENLLLGLGLYFNIKTTFYPFGELRGQLHVIDPIPSINYAFKLNSNRVVPSVENDFIGIGLFSVNCETGFAEYMITHNVTSVIGAYIKSGSIGTDGDILASLHGFNSPIFGSFTFDFSIYDLLTGNNLYIEITSYDYPNGAIRSQIIPEFNYYTYISGYQEVPIVSTYVRGNGVLDDNGNYLIIHNGNNVIKSANIEVGEIGVKGSFGSKLSSAVSPMNGTVQGEFQSGNAYVNLLSSSNSTGTARGQILRRVTECAPIPPYYYSYPDTGYFVTKSQLSSGSSSSDASVLSVSIFSLLLIVLFCI